MAFPTFMTPGAQRSLERAAQLAVSDSADRIDTRHMLWALWLEEGSAAALLAAMGVQRQQLELRIERGSSSVKVDTSDMTEEILYQARQFTQRFDQSGELTSEHLLLAVTHRDDKELQLLGITTNRILELITPTHDTSSLPVSPEYQLSDAAPVATPVQSEKPEPVKPPPAQPHSANERIQAYRAIDAAANRVREGLRVIEDYVRFGLNDQILIGELKACRHEFTETLSGVDGLNRIRSRDTLGDRGTVVSTVRESERDSLQAVAMANMKRVQESLRTLEEFTKFIADPSIQPARLEQVRYRSYTIEKALATTIESNRIFADRRLYLLVTESLCHRPWKDVVIDALAAGVSIVQLREKTMSDQAIIERASWLRQATADANALFIMNDRPDLAALTKADGVHVGQEEMSVARARQIMGPNAIVGVSTHNVRQARNAVMDGADYLGVGPVFPTSTKNFSKYAGLEYVREVAEQTSLPWFAIGGIDGSNLKNAISAGASRIAVSGAMCSSHNVKDDAEQMAGALV